MICMIICALLTIDILSSCNQCNAFLKDKSQNYNKIRLMTFNTGLSNDFKNIRELILFENPDIILFQEVTPHIHDKIKSLNRKKLKLTRSIEKTALERYNLVMPDPQPIIVFMDKKE